MKETRNKKVLVLASVASMIGQFNMPNIRLLQRLGYEVHVACNFREGNTCPPVYAGRLRQQLKAQGVVCYQIDFKRQAWQLFSHGKAYNQLCRILGQHRYTFLHCHSPVGGVVGRLAAHRFQLPVLYTVHGFHFYQGASCKNWLLYYPVEWMLSWWTDVLLTINHEDYRMAIKRLHAKRTVYLPGVGVDTARCYRKRKDADAAKHTGSFVFLHVAELSKRKNQKTVLQAFRQIEQHKKQPLSYQYLLCGIGEQESKLKKYVQNNDLSDKVQFLGYRKDIPQLMEQADAAILSSYQEGLPVAVIEAMAAGLPVIASKIRGNRELVDAQGGILVDADDVQAYEKALVQMMQWKQTQPDKLRKMGVHNRNKSRNYDISRVIEKTEAIYHSMELSRRNEKCRKNRI